MGLSASNGRFLGLTARKSDLEFQGQQINQERMKLSKETEDLFQQYLNIPVPDAALVEINPAAYQAQKDTYDAAIARINADTEIVQQMDRQLEIDLKNVDTSQQAVMTEIEAVQKVIDKNIDSTFKTFA